MKAGDTDAAAALAGVLAFPAYQHGRVATVERWFGWLEDRDAVAARSLDRGHGRDGGGHDRDAGRGRTMGQDRRPGSDRRERAGREPHDRAVAGAAPGAALRDGPDQMRANAELAARTMAAGSFFQAAATLYLATAHLMAGDRDRADLLYSRIRWPRAGSWAG